MYVKILLKYIFGYLNVRIEGFFVERVINKAMSDKILFWNVKRDKSTIVYANVGKNDFEQLSKISESNNCVINIIEQRGVPFLWIRYKKRKAFFIMIIVLFMVLYALSNFVWNIDVEGLNKIDKESIINELEKEGLKIGKFSKNIDTKKIINKIRLDREDISWIGIEIVGTNAKVKIVEAEEKPQIVDDQDYCNIIAAKDAQIVKISAQSGVPVVEEGDFVTKGQILIAGWMEGKYTGTRYVHSSGEIKAKVWYSEKMRMPLNRTESMRTGNFETWYEIKFNNFLINLHKTLSKFQKYDTIVVTKKIKIFSDFYLPIELIKKTNYEITEYERSYGTEEAKQIAIEELSKILDTRVEDKEEILQKHENVYASNDYIDVELIYEVLENIETKEKIVF